MKGRPWLFGGVAAVGLATLMVAWNEARQPADPFHFLRRREPVFESRRAGSDTIVFTRIYHWKAKYWIPMKEAEVEMRSLGATVRHTSKDVGRWWTLRNDELSISVDAGRVSDEGMRTGEVSRATVERSFDFIHVYVVYRRRLNPVEHALQFCGLLR